MKLTILKHGSQWRLVHYLVPPNNNPSPMKQSLPINPLFTPSLRSSDDESAFCLCGFIYLDVSYQWNHTIHDLCLASCPWHHFLRLTRVKHVSLPIPFYG